MQNEALRSVTHIYRSSHTRVTRLHEICKMPLVEDMIRKAMNSYLLKIKKNKDLKDIIYLLIEEAKKNPHMKFATPSNNFFFFLIFIKIGINIII